MIGLPLQLANQRQAVGRCCGAYHQTTTSGFIATTWAGVACAAAKGSAEPARIDPATLRARIAGTTRARLMRMIPPWHIPRSQPPTWLAPRPARPLCHAEVLPVSAPTFISLDTGL